MREFILACNQAFEQDDNGKYHEPDRNPQSLQLFQFSKQVFQFLRNCSSDKGFTTLSRNSCGVYVVLYFRNLIKTLQHCFITKDY